MTSKRERTVISSSRKDLFESYSDRFGKLVIPVCEEVKALKVQIEEKKDKLRAEVETLRSEMDTSFGRSFIYAAGSYKSVAVRDGDHTTDLNVFIPYKLFLEEEDAKVFIEVHSSSFVCVPMPTSTFSLQALFAHVETSYDGEKCTLPLKVPNLRESATMDM